MFQIKLTFFAVVAILLSTSAYAKQTPKIEPRIAHAKYAERGQFPYHAFLRIKYHDRFGYCGGSLISNQWIMSAAHCFTNASVVEIHLGSLIVKKYVWEPHGEAGSKIIKVLLLENFHKHPKYSELLYKK